MDAKMYFRRGFSTGNLVAAEAPGSANSLPVRGYPNGVGRKGLYVVVKAPGIGTTDGTKTLTCTLQDAADNGAGAPGAFANQAEGVALVFAGMLPTTQVRVAKFSVSREWLGLNFTITAGGNFGPVAAFITNEYPQYQ